MSQSTTDAPSELFQVGAHGDASLSRIQVDVAIFCTTPLSHLSKCTTTTKHHPTTTTTVSTVDDDPAHQPSAAPAAAASSSTIDSAAEEPAATCSTGLRVYDGAMVLAEFFASQLFAQSRLYQHLRCPSTATVTAMNSSSGENNINDRPRRFVALELGCGCGLAGLTLWHVLNQEEVPVSSNPSSRVSDLTVVLTDASKPCLEFVQKNYEALLAKTRATTTSDLTKEAAHLDIRVLDWEQSNQFFSGSDINDVGKFWAAPSSNLMTPPLPSSLPSRHFGGADVVFGSDLVYFNASPFTLFKVAERMMRFDDDDDSSSSSSNGDNKAADAEQQQLPSSLTMLPPPPSSHHHDHRFPPVLLLCHHCRIPNGIFTLTRAATDAGLALFSLPLTSFLPDAEILPRCRGGMQFLIACRLKDADRVQKSLFHQPDILGVFREVVQDEVASLMMCSIGDDE
jgi:hypothetical protein